LAKVIVHAHNRAQAIDRLAADLMSSTGRV
jgi:acetyl/propionyl-CoA carboxylase alpha subunit